MLTGDEDVYYDCEKCKEHTAATLYMRIQRFPRVLQLHIKRFKYAGAHSHQLRLIHHCHDTGTDLNSFLPNMRVVQNIIRQLTYIWADYNKCPIILYHLARKLFHA